MMDSVSVTVPPYILTNCPVTLEIGQVFPQKEFPKHSGQREV